MDGNAKKDLQAFYLETVRVQLIVGVFYFKCLELGGASN